MSNKGLYTAAVSKSYRKSLLILIYESPGHELDRVTKFDHTSGCFTEKMTEMSQVLEISAKILDEFSRIYQ